MCVMLNLDWQEFDGLLMEHSKFTRKGRRLLFEFLQREAKRPEPRVRVYDASGICVTFTQYRDWDELVETVGTGEEWEESRSIEALREITTVLSEDDDPEEIFVVMDF